jgi:hypothetical protein
MEKLSGILPSSPRIKSVDLDEAPPARPGAPRFGKKQGRNTIADQVTLSAQAKALADASIQGARDPKEIARGKMVDEISKNFFETRLNKTAKLSEETADVIASQPEVDVNSLSGLKAYQKESEPKPSSEFEVQA